LSGADILGVFVVYLVEGCNVYLASVKIVLRPAPVSAKKKGHHLASLFFR